MNIHNSQNLQSSFKVFSLNQCTKTVRSVLAKGVLCMSYSALSMMPVFAMDSGQLNTLITQAIDTHPSIGAAKSEQQATTEGVHAAKLNLLPQPSFSAGYNSENDLVSNFNIRQNLWTGGRLTASVNQAIFDDKAATEHIFEAQNEVAKTTIDAWQSYITAVSLQQVYLSSLKRLDDFEQMMTRRVNQGVSARIELDLVTNRILQEQNAYQGALEQQRIAVARLEQIIGQPFEQGSVPDLAELVQQAKLQASGFEKIVFDELSFSNPTVVKQRYQVEAAKQEVKTKEAARYPTVYAQYQHTYYLKDKKNDNKVSLGLDYQPGAGFSDKALTKASIARVQGLEQSEEAVRRKALENIQVQYQQFVSARDQELSLVAAVSGAQIVLNSYQRQFIAGRKSWLDVLNAAREQSQYEVQLVNTRTNLLGAFYKLQVDFGMMDWQEFQKNREPVQMFHPFDPVKAWLNKHDLIKNTDTNPDIESDAKIDVGEQGSTVQNPTINETFITNPEVQQGAPSYDYMPYTGESQAQVNSTINSGEITAIQDAVVEDNEKNVVKEKFESGKKWLKGLFGHKKQDKEPSQPLNDVHDINETPVNEPSINKTPMNENSTINTPVQPNSLQKTTIESSSTVAQPYQPQNFVQPNVQPRFAPPQFKHQGDKQPSFKPQEFTPQPEPSLPKVVSPQPEFIQNGVNNGENEIGVQKQKVGFAQKLLQKVSQKNLPSPKVENTKPEPEEITGSRWALTSLEQAEKVDLKLNHVNRIH